MPSLPNNVFRANVGIVLLDKKGRVLALEREDVKGAWQLPQGGLEEDEQPIDGALRELQEETAIRRENVELLAEYPEWLAYELPPEKRSSKTGRGQVQKWFLFRFTGVDIEINLNNASEKEFSSWQWMSFQELSDKTVFFRRGIYEKLVAGFSAHFPSANPLD